MSGPSEASAVVAGDRETMWVHTDEAGTVAMLTRPGPGKDRSEDAAAVIPVDGGGVVLAVADGFAGRPGGEQAARIALESLQTAVAGAHRKHVPVRGPMLDGFERANAGVLGLGGGAATTLAAADVFDGRLRTYVVGDSQILAVGQRGKIKLLTMPQSPVGYALEAGLLDEEGALRHAERHFVSNMVGEPGMRVQVTVSLQLDPLDTVVVATDGLWDNVTVGEIAERVRSGPLDQALRALDELCGQRMQHGDGGRPAAPDDCTIVLYRR